ncbi:lysophospholipid acyltransferase family protein [Candidatus Leptofilum sp.]|uniref:lysophospholipid acyltransferase family protein n=1 Tax=Candidatus Leptofilum sp. TaxID=3241576 RepID=UPI003B594EB5
MNPYFPGDSYHTPNDTPRHWLDRLFLGSRLALHTHFIWEIIKARRLVTRKAYNRKAWGATAYAIFKMVEQCNGRFHITGLDNIHDLSESVVFVSNHVSSLEGNVLGCLLPHHQEVSFVIKESLTRYPVFGPVIGARQPITVGRTNPREDLQKVLTEGVTMLQNGRSIILFPQHTRTPTFVPDEFNSLGVKLAKRAGVPVVPIAVKTDFLINGRYLRDFGPLDRHQPIYMAFGQPFRVTNSKQAHWAIIQYIERHWAQWQQSA